MSRIQKNRTLTAMIMILALVATPLAAQDSPSVGVFDQVRQVVAQAFDWLIDLATIESEATAGDEGNEEPPSGAPFAIDPHG